MKKVLLQLLLLTVCYSSFSQKEDSIKVDTTRRVLTLQTDFAPKIFPPSPNAAQLGRFGEVPVSLTNGTLSYQIPIFEVVSGNLKVPISLDYQGSGLKVNDISSVVGTGWTLKAGGAITKTVRGIDDEDVYGYLSHDYPQPLLPLTDECYIAAALLNQKDPQPDLWFYNFNEYSGSYIYSRPYDANNNLFLTNQTPVSILYPHESTLKLTNDGNTKEITDNTGTVYSFGVQEITNANSKFFTSAYYLSKIKNQLGDEILFSYIDASYTEGVYNRILRTKQVQSTTLTNLSHEQNFSSTNYYQKQLSDIYFTNGKVHFSYVNDRQDNPSAGRLDAIIIYKKTSSNSYSEIKRYQLVQDYFSCRDEASRVDFNPSSFSHSTTSPLLKRLRFKSVEEIPVVGVAQNTKYSLEYYDNLPLPIHYSMSQDYWGYYNGVINSRNLLVWDTNNLNTLPNMSDGANRNPDLTYAVLGSLKSITYPTKGKSEFAYELNKGADNKAAGGLRIQSVTSYDNSGNKTGEKTYNYIKPYYISNVYEGDLNNLVLSTRLDYEVNPCECNVNTQQLTETIYQEEVGLVLGGSSSVAYEEVEEYTVDYTTPSTRLGKTFYKFSEYQDYDARPIPNMSINYSWKRGRLLEKWHYQIVGNTETFLSKEINIYQSFPLPYRASQLSVYQTFLFIPCESASVPICRQSNPRCETLPEGIKIADEYLADFLHQNAESILLVSSEQIRYDDNGLNPISTKNDYEYADFPYTQSNKTTQTNSDSKVFATKTKYPYHFGTMPYTEMVTKRIIAPSIETTEELDNVQQAKVVNNYQKLGSIFTVSTIQTQLKSTDAVTTEITFTNYDAYGNPLSWVEDGITTDLTYYTDSDYGKTRLVKEKIVNGQTTFFDYEPLFGLKEIKLPNNVQTFYKYDGVGRLFNVKDHNGNITDQYNYNYSTTAPTGCTTPDAPSISISSSNLCDATLTASGCSGTVNWSNGVAGASINVLTKTTTTYTATCTVDGCTSSASNGLIVPILPSGWSSADIGTASGCSQVSSGNLTSQGSGSMGANDIFHYVYKEQSGDFTAIVKLNSITSDDGDRSGIMIRSSLNDNALDFTIFQDGNSFVGFFRREANGDNNIFSGFQQATINATWLKLVRTGNKLYFYYSTDANPVISGNWLSDFSLVNGGSFPTTLSMGSSLYIGLATWGNASLTTFTNFTINGQSF